MNETVQYQNEVYDAEHIKTAFYMYMQELNTDVNPKTLKTYCSDAMFIWAQLPDPWVWEIVDGGACSDEEWKSRLQTYIRRDITAVRAYPDKDARSYTKHFWQLITFLRIFQHIVKGRLAVPRRIGE